MRKKKRDRVRDTYFLETAEGGTCQIKERKRPSEGHSLSGDSRGGGGGTCQDRQKATERGALTSWRRQRKGLVRTKKGSDSD